MATNNAGKEDKGPKGIQTGEDSLERREEKGKKVLRFRMMNILTSQKVHPLASSSMSLERSSCTYSANSRIHRIWMTTKILGVSAVAILVLFAFAIVDLKESLSSMENENKVKHDVQFSIKVADLIHALQVERGMTVLSISSKGNQNITKKLRDKRLETNTALRGVLDWLQEHKEVNFHSKPAIELKLIENHRNSIGYGEKSNIEKEIQFYTAIIDDSLQWLFDSFRESFPETVLFDLLGYQMFLAAKDKTGIERALGGSFFASGHFNTSELLWYAEHNILGKAFLNTSMKLMPGLKSLYENEVTRKPSNLKEQVGLGRSTILKNEPRPPNSTAGNLWFNLMSDYINMLLAVEKRAGTQIIDKLDESTNKKEKSFIIQIAVLVLVLILTPLLVLAVIRMTNTIQKYAAKLEEITVDLKEEQKRTDSVLSAMFPKSVAESLKRGEKVNSEYFDSVTVFFSDIVNFTNICACISPIEVTSMLNNIYSAFDDKIDKYDVYKVETIGDAYMVASGLPVKNGGKHVDEICRMALDLVKVTSSLRLVEVPGETLLIRVGIHTGPCVSGIVGNKMPRYCLFGDTVNTASRMQTTGEPQKIHVSEGSQKALRPFKHYVLEFRGYVEVKGKGEMQTYWLHDNEFFSSDNITCI